VSLIIKIPPTLSVNNLCIEGRNLILMSGLEILLLAAIVYAIVT